MKVREEIYGGASFGDPQNQLKIIEGAEVLLLKETLLKEYKARVNKANATRWWPWGKTKRSLTSLDIENQLTSKLPEAYLDIRKLVGARDGTVQTMALMLWQEKEDSLIKQVERKNSKVAELKNEVYQLVGFFSVFQGVVLTAVAQASQLHCSSCWIPISLSILASVVTITGVIQKLDQISASQKTVHLLERSVQEVKARQYIPLGRPGPKTIVKSFDTRETPERRRSQQFFYFAFVIISLLTFSVVPYIF